MITLPTDGARDAAQTFRGRHLVAFSQPLTTALTALAEREGVTLFVALLAAFQALLFRYAHDEDEDVLVGASLLGRDRIDAEPSIDRVGTTVVLRTHRSDDPSFLELLGRVSEACERPPGEPSHTRVMFTMRQGPVAALDAAEDLSHSLPELDASVCDLTLSVVETNQELAGTLIYNADVFESSTIARMAGHFQTLLEGIAVTPEQRLSALPVLTQSERHQLLVEWNDTSADYPRDSCVHRLFEQQVERTPDALALDSATGQLTYQELNRRANRLSHRLQVLGVGPEVLVGICIERSVDMVVALLAVLKAGGAYVPLDPSYPTERLAFMLADAHASVLLTREGLVVRFGQVSAQVVCMDGDAEGWADEPEDNPDSGVTSENLAYVIYTSGSTGQPKGVLIPHRGLVNYLWWATSAYAVADGSGAPVHTSLGFDLTITSIFTPLLVGRTAVLLREEPGIDALAACLREGNDSTPVKITPAHLSLLNRQLPAEQAAGRARVLVIGGEALSWETLEFWQRHAPATRLINEYGPTETVVGCCVYEASARPGRTGPVPIGRPIANTQLYVLDRHRQPVPIGVPGELYIGGDGVGRGYLNRPELTAASFVPDPFNQVPGTRLYKTGDLARYLPDGNLEFLGRIDHQVKLRGFRVELGEIEAVLDQHPRVQQNVALVREDAPGKRQLVAYVVPKGDAPLAGELRRFLNEKLPDFMVPSTIVVLNELPLTLNGKIDRQALPPPDSPRPELRSELVSPRDELEHQLAGIWEEALKFRPVGVRDDFFELGGDSLMATEVMLEIEHALGKRLSLATLFKAPTVELLAGVLRQDGGPALPPHIVAIRDTGSTRPFFCIPGLGGNILSLRHLARHLDPNQVMYGLEPPDGDTPPGQEGVRRLASTYVEEIRTIQPTGPYCLGGFSFGGLLVFEMAQQLRMQGQQVALLALFDSYGPGYLHSGSRVMLHELRGLRRGERLSYLVARTVDVTRRIRNMLTRRRPDPPYEPAVYPGRVTLFRCETQSPECRHDPQMGWGRVAGGGLEIHQIPGDHFTVIEKHAPQLAERLTACLTKVAN